MDSSRRASAITLSLALICGTILVSALGIIVSVGLRSIGNAITWLKNEQTDGTTMMLRSEDGEYDSQVLERLRNAKYSLSVWFLEMHKVAEAVDELAVNSNELKMFFPSVFVGMTKEEFARGVYKTELRTKNVSVLFLDIVKYTLFFDENVILFQILCYLYYS